MATRNLLAFDLGAESGRAVVGAFDGRSLRLQEVHRFPNRPVCVAGHLHWDVLHLFDQMQIGLYHAAQQFGAIESVGTDTWGVDYALLDASGTLIGNPYHYRDTRTDGMLEEAFRRVPRERIYQATGIQFMRANSLYQLLAMTLEESPALKIAQTLLFMPDLFNFWLCGEKASEFTIASTSQFYDPRKGNWARPLLDELNIPHSFLPRIVPSGTDLGRLAPALATRKGLEQTRIIAPACHDTGSAVAAVPTSLSDYAFISSGTWSLMGTEVRDPIINAQGLEFNFSNEGSAGGAYRLLKNITGMWLLQECRRSWERTGSQLSYAELTAMSGQAKPFARFVNPDDPSFLHPDDMPAAIVRFCERTGQPPPQDRCDFVRCALESIALAYRRTLAQLETLIAKRPEVIHIVGGGSQNRMLCQFAADSCDRPVLAGPTEATALGNIIMQMIAQKIVGSIAEGRALVRDLFPPIIYEPHGTMGWDEACDRFQRLLV